MKKLILTIAALAVSAMFIEAGAQFLPCPIKPDETHLLYPQGQNVDEGITKSALSNAPAAKKSRKKSAAPALVKVKITEGPGESNNLEQKEVMDNGGGIYSVGDSARFDIYLPKSNPTKQMVVVCPGGSYAGLSSWNEGVYVAKWLTDNGIAACVMTYRMPNGHWEIPLTDVQNAFRYCRANAERYGVDQIGIIGFSAGGHLAATTSTLYVDSITRPDFSILIYPVITMDKKYTHMGTRENLLGREKYWEDKVASGDKKAEAQHNGLIATYTLEKNITSDTPPTFIALSADDSAVPPKNSLDYFQELVAHKVPCQLYIYPTGEHGWGFTTSEYRGDGKDGIGPYRQEFFTALKRFLGEVRESTK